jgi:hypothetical protein
MTKTDPFDVGNLQLDPATFPVPPVPTKIQKRRQQFAMVPMWWYEKLKDPIATGATCLVAWHLLHLGWKNLGKPFNLPNGMLGYDGISRQSKWRALAELERRGLITIERRRRKSPVIHLKLYA